MTCGHEDASISLSISGVGCHSPLVPDEVIDRFSFADVFPVLGHAFAGPHWVRRGVGVGDQHAAPIEPPDGSIPMWDVEQGRYLGVTPMPDGFTPHVAQGDRITGVSRGAFDVEIVSVYRVEGLGL